MAIRVSRSERISGRSRIMRSMKSADATKPSPTIAQRVERPAAPDIGCLPIQVRGSARHRCDAVWLAPPTTPAPAATVAMVARNHQPLEQLLDLLAHEIGRTRHARD